MAVARVQDLEKLLRDRGLGRALPKLEAPRHPPLPTGRADLDRRLGGGLPRGAISELTGPESSGRTGLLFSILAQATQADELAVYVDATDALDPRTAEEAGIVLENVLWVRCEPKRTRRWETSLRGEQADPAWQALNLAAAAGGFGVAAADLGGLPMRRLEQWRRRPWVRLKQAIEHSSTVLAVLAERHVAGSAAALTLELERADGPGGVLLADEATVRVEIGRERLRRARLTA